MSEHKEISIHKRNELVRGANPYTLNAQRLGNAIYHHIQINKHFEDAPFKIPVQDVIEIMNLGKSKRYIELIKKSLIELTKPIEIYNPKILSLFTKNDKQTVLWKAIPFISDVQLTKEGKTTYIEGSMSNSMRIILAHSNEGNFTPLVLNTYLTKLQSKHSYVLYEYIESYKNDNNRKSKIVFSFERLDKMFNLKGSAKYKYFSKFLPLLERSIEDINKNTNMYVKLAVDKQRKQYIIYRIFQYSKKEVVKTVYIKDKISDDEMYAHPNGLFSN